MEKKKEGEKKKEKEPGKKKSEKTEKVKEHKAEKQDLKQQQPKYESIASQIGEDKQS